MTKQKKLLRRFWPLLVILLVFFYCLRQPSMPAELWVWAKTHGVSPSDYPRSLIDLYERNEDARDFVRDYPLKHNQSSEIILSEEVNTNAVPLLMQWDERWGYQIYNENLMGLSGCGPTCMSMAAIYLTGDSSLNPWVMAQYAEQHGYHVVGSGTSWNFFSDGAAGLGLESISIPNDRERILANLKVGNPIVCVVGPGDFTSAGHFILLVSEKNGKIQVNDPNSLMRSSQLWDYETLAPQIQGLWVLRA